MKKFIRALVSAAAVLSVASSAFAAVPINTLQSYDSDETVTFIVEVEGDALLAGEEAAELGTDYIQTDEAQQQEQSLLKTQAAVKSSIKKEAKVKNSVGYTYTAVLNGFSIEAPLSKMDEIKAIDGVKGVYIARNLETQLATATEMTSSLPSQTVDQYSETGYTGDGQVVAIIDSEFDTGHEFFSHAPENPSLSKSDIADILDSNTMNVDIAANQVYKSAKIPFAYDYVNDTADTYHRDVDSVHGTHVSGIVGGKGGSVTALNEDGEEQEYTFSGVAPEAQLVMMKVSSEDGASIDMSAALAAIDDAAKIGVCAINMSFGVTAASSAVIPVYDEALENARNAGVMLLVSNGNAGMGTQMYSNDTDKPDNFTAGLPATNRWSTAVAAGVNTYNLLELGTITASDGTVMYYKNTFGSGFGTDLVGEAEYIDCGTGSAEDLAGLDLTGKVAILTRTGSGISALIPSIAALGATGVVVVNSMDGIANFANTYDQDIPVAIVEKTAGEHLKTAEDKTMTISETAMTSAPSSNAGTIASFSSWGVDDSLELKPEITAPGAFIYSSYPDDEYISEEGTSMAAPHMTGVAALMNEYLDKSGSNLAGAERVAMIENMLMSSADTIYQQENGVPYSPRVQGAGMVNTAAAMKTSAVFIGNSGKSKLSLGADLEDTLTLDFKVKNITDTEVTYDTTSLDVIIDGYETEEDGSTKVVLDNSVPLSIVSNDLPTSVTVPANGEVSLSVNVTLDKDELEANSEVFTNGFFIDGFVTLASSTEDVVTISMPFTGFYGDWASQPVLDKTMYDEGGSDLRSYSSTGTYLLTYFDDGAAGALAGLGYDGHGHWNRDMIALSPNGDDRGDVLYMYLAAWRSITDITLELFNGDGESVAQEELSGVAPKYSAIGLQFDVFDEFSEEELPDGDYTFRVSGRLNYDGAEPEYFELPMAIDRVEPVITSAALDGDTLTVSYSDNNYILYSMMYYTDENGETVTQYAVPDDDERYSTTAAFDMTGLDADNVYIEILDAAYNVKEAVVSGLLGSVCATVRSYTALEGMSTATIELTNSDDTAIEGSAILAFYDEDGKLLAADFQDISIDAGETVECDFQMSSDTQEQELVKLYIWDSENGMRPLDISKTLK